MQALLEPSSLLQLVAVGVAVALGWWLADLLRGRIAAQEPPTDPRGRLREALWVVAPVAVVALLLATLDGAMHALALEAGYVNVAVQLAGLLLLIRLGIYVLRVSLGERTRIKGWGTPVSLALWAFVSVRLLGWGDEVVAALDGVGLQVGSTRISIWSVTKLLVTVSLFVIAALWISRWLERRILSVAALGPNVRIGIAKFLQAFLVGLSVLIGLNSAGLDLTTLNVLTGAIGIGLGFGLQSIAANFVSGFVLLMDRSIKPGDVISYAGTAGTTTEAFGWVQEMRGRYVVVRDRDGIDTLVPNQQLITNPVINWSYADPRVRLKLPVQVSYDSDPEFAMELLIRAADGHRRIVRDPAPVARLMAFADSGIQLELRFWIVDPQEGVNNVRSDVNRAIWRLFKQHGVSIPYPQRDVRVQMVPGGAGGPPHVASD